MREPFLEFEWRVAAGGYEWSDVSDANGERASEPSPEDFRSPLAVERAWHRLEIKGAGTGPVLKPRGLVLREYRPMLRQHATLFLTFADLDYRDRDAIRRFADTYGELGMGPMGASLKTYRESHLTWAREICRMRDALDLARTRTEKEQTDERELWRFGYEPDRANRERRDKLRSLFGTYLRHVTGRMTIEPGVPARLSLAPVSLLAAMWLQFALAFAGDKRFVACKFCGRLFEISTEQSGHRSHREFCDNPSCKTLDYRRRRRIARKLAEEGSSPSSIAEQIDTNKATVRKWLAAFKAHRKGKE